MRNWQRRMRKKIRDERAQLQPLSPVPVEKTETGHDDDSDDDDDCCCCWCCCVEDDSMDLEVGPLVRLGEEWLIE